MRRVIAIAFATFVAVFAAAAWLLPAPAWMKGAMIEERLMDVTAMAGFRLNNLTVMGRNQTAPDDIIAAVNVEQGAPILTIDLASTREAIESLPWVERARVERQLPDTIHIEIEERKAFALWQRDGRYTLVDATGNTIGDVAGAYGNLPLIVGAGAPARAAEMLAEVAKTPQLASRAKAYVLVGGRRWNIHFDAFDTGIAVRFPEDEFAEALQRLAALQRDHRILERDLVFIDLRLPDRLVVRVRGADPGLAQSNNKSKPAEKTGPKKSV